MQFIIFLLLLASLQSRASIDIGVGTSSITGGRPAPSLALGMETDSWGMLYRSEGVQTSIYSQNAWTVAAYKTMLNEKNGIIGSKIGAGFGGSYILRTFRESSANEIESNKDFVFGPHLSLKILLGPVYLGFDTLLGLTRQIEQHLTLNFQDVSHISLGISF